MRVINTYFVTVISKPFGEEVREIKKVYELADAKTFMVETQGKTTTYETITSAEFEKLRENGL